MFLERKVITDAIATAPNLTVAAKRLGASRRTLQNRMRQYDLPRGRSGRPKELLPYRSSTAGDLLTVVGVLAGAFFVGRWWLNRKPLVIAGLPRG